MTDFPDLKIKALVNFPADVIGDAGIDVDKIGGRYHLNLAYDDFAPPITGIPDTTNQMVLLWNAITEEYALASIAVVTGATGEFIQLTGDGPGLQITGYTEGLYYGPFIQSEMYRGTQEAPVAVQNGDILMGFGVDAYDGTNLINRAALFCVVDAPVSTGVLPSSWVFYTGTSAVAERLTIGSQGHVHVGTGVALPTLFNITPDLGVSAGRGVLGLSRFQNSADAPFISFAKSRGATLGAHGAVHNGDYLGSIEFGGSDGSTYNWGAEIAAYVEGTPSVGNVPTAVAIGTMPVGVGANVIERIRFSSAGHTIFMPGSTTPPTLTANNQLNFTPTSNTNLRVSYRGSDGATKTANITLS